MAENLKNRIYREGDVTVVEAYNGRDPNLGKQPGVESMGVEGWWRKRFFNRAITMLDDAGEQLAQLRAGKNVIVIGVTGRSKLDPEELERWGLQVGEYEIALRNLFASALLDLRVVDRRIRPFPVDLRFVHGGAGQGVDKAAIDVCRHYKVPMTGITPATYALYVEDVSEGFPVIATAELDAYIDGFVSCVDVLVATGGREEVLRQYTQAALTRLKTVVPCPVLKAIARYNGGPGGLTPGGGVDDATVAMQQLIRTMGADAPAKVTMEEVRKHLVDELTAYAARKFQLGTVLPWQF